MFDLFGRKRIRQLEESLADNNRLFNIQQIGWKESEERLSAMRNQVEYLVRTIRDMDQEIWNMAQKLDWPAQRPHFVKLQDGMTARKHAENERINDILRPQLIETYGPKPMNMKQIGSKP